MTQKPKKTVNNGQEEEPNCPANIAKTPDQLLQKYDDLLKDKVKKLKPAVASMKSPIVRGR